MAFFPFDLLCFNIISVQVGHDKQGLPIGLQLIGRPWGEATILRVASAVEVMIFCSSNIRSYAYRKDTFKVKMIEKHYLKLIHFTTLFNLSISLPPFFMVKIEEIEQ